MHKRFTDNSGALSLRIKRTTYKHCRDCSYRLEGVPKFLQAHYKRYHKDQEAVWLQYDDRPVHSCNSYFETYLSNPDTELMLKPNFKFPGGGGRLPA